jgi:hypothetical protein
MKRPMVLALALCMTALLSPGRASADAATAQMTGRALYDICKNQAAVTQAVCGTYILGALDMVDAAASFKPPRKLCPRPGENSDTMQRSFMLQMEVFPQDGETHTAAQIIASQIACKR